MAEYKSFHYLMHQVPDAVKPVYVTGPAPLNFGELYSPRSGCVLVYKGEKSFWRTRDRIEFCMYEDRSSKVLITTCRNLDKPEVYRTIFLDLEVLYFELESKAQGNRDRLVRKKDKKLSGDEVLYKAGAEFVLARLNIGADPLPWPDFSAPAPSIDGASETLPAETEATPKEVGPVERMCTFTKMANDVYDSLEINPPNGVKFEGIPPEFLKLKPVTSSAGGGVDASTSTDAAPGAASSTGVESTEATAAPSGDATAAATTTSTTSKPAAATKTAATTAPAKGRATIVSKPAVTAASTSASKGDSTAAPTATVAAGAVAGDRAKPTAKPVAAAGVLKNNKVAPL